MFLQNGSSELVPYADAEGRQTGPERAGIGRLRFARVQDHTVVTHASATAPLKLLNPRSRESSAWVYAATYGGGLLGGDAVRLHVDVDARAAAFVSTQSSTKVYRADREATQELDARVGDEGLLVWWPDPVTCFAGSDYRQEQRIRLAPRANLVFVDRLTAGRIDAGERWMFTRYASRTTVWQGDDLVLHDALRLEPARAPVRRRMGRFNCVAVAVLLGPMLAESAMRIREELAAAPLAREPALLTSWASAGDRGCVIRVAAHSIEAAAAELRRHLDAVPTLLGDDPWARRW